MKLWMPRFRSWAKPGLISPRFKSKSLTFTPWLCSISINWWASKDPFSTEIHNNCGYVRREKQKIFSNICMFGRGKYVSTTFPCYSSIPDTFVGVFSSFAFLNGGGEGVCSLHNKTATLWLHRLCFALIAILLSGLFYYDSHNFWSDLWSRT